jgi:NADH-quinone oxidoreductase subunit M
LRMVQRAFLGANTHAWKLPDLTPREGVMMTLMIVGLLWLGFYPQPVLDTFRPALDNLQRDAQMSVALLRR